MQIECRDDVVDAWLCHVNFDESSDELVAATVACEESTDLNYLDWAKWYSSDKLALGGMTVRYTVAGFSSFTTGPF